MNQGANVQQTLQALHDRILRLEERVHSLTARLRRLDLSGTEREHIQIQITIAQTVLSQIRRGAFEPEQKLKPRQDARQNVIQNA